MPTLRIPMLALAASLVFLASPIARAADGDLDPSFGNGGVAFFTPDDVEARELQPNATIVLPDGKILFGGSRSKHNPAVPFEPEYRCMLARLNADGSVDTSFGDTTIPGVLVLPALVPGARLEGIEAMRRFDDGSLVAVGVSHVNTPTEGFVVKLDENGAIDPSFGTDGVVLVPNTYLHAVAIDGAGHIVAAGEHVDSNLVYTTTLLRYDADGTPDTSFGDVGTASITWDGAGNSGYVYDIAPTGDGGILVAGSYSVYGDGLGGDFAVAKLDADGALDPAFAGTGERVFHDPDSPSFINGINRIAIEPDGRIDFAGYYMPADNMTALILGRLDANGDTDTTFGDASSPGYLRPPMPTGAETANVTGFVRQDDGKLIAGISYYSGAEKQDFYAIRATADGALDTDFAAGGVFDFDLAPGGVYNDLSTLALDADGNVILAGRSMRDSASPIVDLGAVRLLNGSGSTDRIFADDFEL